jgi:metal-responsive CopG/Arc/MetJ family transcriptional regulator
MANVKITVRVPQEQLALLDEMKTRIGRPREESIRRAIERYLRAAKMFHGKHDGETSEGSGYGNQRNDARQSAE